MTENHTHHAHLVEQRRKLHKGDQPPDEQIAKHLDRKISAASALINPASANVRKSSAKAKLAENARIAHM